MQMVEMFYSRKYSTLNTDYNKGHNILIINLLDMELDVLHWPQ
jgi:hypothetical protein